MDCIIIPVLKDKKGVLTDKNNYRPIAVTSVFSKILESIILVKYEDILESGPNQFGFKSKHSTDLCVFSLKQVIEFYHSLSSPVYVCFLDASKAFDKLNHWTLFYKLLDRGMPLIIVRLFMYWYSSQEFSIRWGSTYSDSFRISNGVRQGGLISPLYFNLYMDGLSALLTDSKVGCCINGTRINHLMYADDSCIIAASPSSLQKLLDICSDYAMDNTITYNESKTKCVCFKPKSLHKLQVPPIYLNSSQLKFESCVKYLGVFLNETCSDEDDMVRHKRYLYATGNLLISRFKSCSDEVKRMLFKTFCYSAYGGHLWTKYKDSNFSKVTVAYNDVYRHLFYIKRGTSMSMEYVTNNLHCFKSLMRKASFNFRKRLLLSGNIYIKTIVHSVFFYKHSSFTQMWLKDLFV